MARRKCQPADTPGRHSANKPKTKILRLAGTFPPKAICGHRKGIRTTTGGHGRRMAARHLRTHARYGARAENASHKQRLGEAAKPLVIGGFTRRMDSVGWSAWRTTVQRRIFWPPTATTRCARLSSQHAPNERVACMRQNWRVASRSGTSEPLPSGSPVVGGPLAQSAGIGHGRSAHPCGRRAHCHRRLAYRRPDVARRVDAHCQSRWEGDARLKRRLPHTLPPDEQP